jgi:hypothetical protein
VGNAARSTVTTANLDSTDISSEILFNAQRRLPSKPGVAGSSPAGRASKFAKTPFVNPGRVTTLDDFRNWFISAA